jgi:transposase-like protein
MAVTVDGQRDILGIWAGDGGEGAKHWLHVLTELKNRGVVAFDVEIRKVICSTNAIESVNARIRRAVRARGHFPNEQAALKCIYMALMSLDPTGTGRRRWTMRWKAPLNAFQIAFEGRLTPANH